MPARFEDQGRFKFSLATNTSFLASALATFLEYPCIFRNYLEFSCSSCRLGAMHERAQRVDPATGQPAHRAIPERQLGRGLQGSSYRPPSDVFRQRGTHPQGDQSTNLCD